MQRDANESDQVQEVSLGANLFRCHERTTCMHNKLVH